MKKIFILVLCTLLVLLTACSSKTDTQTAQPNSPSASEATEAVELASVTEASVASTNDTKLQWPLEFEKWGIPQLESGTLTVADNKSVVDGVMTTGLVAIVNVSDVSPEAFKGYSDALVSSGLVLSPDSLGEALSFYEGKTDTGILKVTVSYSSGTVSIIADNPGAADTKTASPASAANWPEAAKDIPAFTAGSYIETIDMGGNMYTLTYKDVPASALDAYKETLLAAGFMDQGNADTDGYARMDAHASYSVGFYMSGEALQIIIAIGTY